jgi:hypothetical protein
VLSPTKVASTSVGSLLSTFCDIRIGTPAFGKHEHIDLIRNRFDWIFEKAPLDSFKIFLLFRSPLDRAVSLYTSHLKPEFDGSPTSTKDMPIDVFAKQWLPKNTWMSLPQFLHGMLTDHGFVVDYIITADNLGQDLVDALSLVGVTPKVDNLAHSNKSPERQNKDRIRDELRDAIGDLYAVDQYILDNHSNSPITNENKSTITRYINNYYSGEENKSKIETEIIGRMKNIV